MPPRTVLLGQAAAAALLALALMTSAQAQRVVRDSATGQLRAPTAEETKALEAATRARKHAPPVGLLSGKVNPAPVLHRDGTVEQELDESTLMYAVARRNPDGTLSTYCVPGQEEADRVLKGKVASRVAKAAKEHQHEQK